LRFVRNFHLVLRRRPRNNCRRGQWGVHRSKGDFYNPNYTQVLQESPAIIKFEGLTERGGRQVVEGYRKAFKKDVMGEYIAHKLEEIAEQLDKDGSKAPAGEFKSGRIRFSNERETRQDELGNLSRIAVVANDCR
jgi:hypothetical protein